MSTPPHPPPLPPRLRRWAAASALGLALGLAILGLGRLLTGAWAPAFAVTVAGVFGLAWSSRLALWWGYRPLQLRADERARLPGLTVVIPAYNEGEMVLETIGSVLASHYPADRLRVIAVDDGSDDDTGAHLEAAAARWPRRVEVLRLPTNRGKRHALHAGFGRAQTELVATIDSDCVVAADALAHLVAPLVRDRRVAAVAGKVTAHNRRQNLLTRMLAVRYVLGFDFVRAYQSRLRTVWCCPGAIQAYRRAVIAPHLDAWRDQRFLGARCTNGDDHAMTNLVLSQGWDSAYQSNAVVRTVVPATYARLCGMYVRWGRSATREGLRAMAWAPLRAAERGGVHGALVLLDAALQPLTIGLRLVGPFAAAAALWLDPALVLQGAALTTAVALGYCGVYLRSERSPATFFGLLYAWFAMIALPWVQPFATLTVRRNGWLTRGRTR